MDEDQNYFGKIPFFGISPWGRSQVYSAHLTDAVILTYFVPKYALLIQRPNWVDNNVIFFI